MERGLSLPLLRIADGLPSVAALCDEVLALGLPEDRTRRRVFAAQLEATTRALRSMLFIVLVSMICILPIFWRTSSKPLMLAGALIMCATCAWAARKLPARVDPDRAHRAARRHLGVAASLGLAWAVLTLGLAAGASGEDMILVGCVQIAFVAVGFILYLNLPVAFLAFAIPVSVPLMADLCTAPGGWVIAFVVLPLFILILTRAAIVQCRMFVEAGQTAERLRAGQAEAHAEAQSRSHMALEQAERHMAETARTALDRRHELLGLATAFEDSIGHALDSVSDAARDLELAARQLTGIVESTARTAGDVADRAVSASRSIGELGASTRHMIETINAVTGQVSLHSARSAQALRLADGSARRVGEMGDEAADMSGIVGIVDGVTKQTRLLALNAQIEAARAGEAGRGFAVVASEVKSLAQTAADATGGISAQIRTIQDHAGATVQSIRATAAEIDQVAGIAAGIEMAMLEQQRIAEHIGEESLSVGRNADDVRDRMASLASESVSAAALTAQVQQTAIDVAQEMAALKTAAAGFLTGLRTA